MKNRMAGLSLMEVLITLVIVAIVSSMAYPRYRKMVSRSKQTEAKTMLQALYVAEDLYKTLNSDYTGDIDLLDIDLPDNSRYQYALEVSDDNSKFTAIATANIDSDDTLDEWRIDEGNNLTNSVNDVIE